MIVLGLISGTSMDGIDAIAARFEAAEFRAIVATLHVDYPNTLRQQLLHIAREQPALSARDWCALDAAVADAFADAALQLIDAHAINREDIAAIGSHGQTLFHDASSEPRLTLQVGDPNRIAARTGLTVVADFRRRDLALGGQGAPLVPAFHHALFATPGERRAVLNLGGIANLTLLPGDDASQVRGFDTGPGNGLLDEWAALHLRQPFDAEGRFAHSGRAQPRLLEALLGEPYFALPAPKSSGRGDFHLDWVRKRYPALDQLAPADVQATLAELTASSVVTALARADFAAERVLVCGGGVRNPDLLQRISARLPGVTVEATDRYGLDAQWVEATAFAWLAARTLNGLAGNLPTVTGASRSAVLGGIYRA
ncbi:MAG: anhydro-N-acetylmuramic acid kinase [Nevskia sp.]|nr:anhydro-N-acetylmuramic acid kinase [Nevskia sp.]